MGLDLDDIKEVGTMNFVGFSRETSLIVEKVTLPVETQRVVIYSKMMVIDANSAFNVILGKPWLHEMKAVPSSYPQMIKFLVCRKKKSNATKFMPVLVFFQP